MRSCEMVWRIMWRSFRSLREVAAKLVEEIEDEADLVHRSGLLCDRGLQYGEAFAVGVQAKVRVAKPAVGELAGRPELGLVGMEGIAGSGVGNHADLAVRRTIKKLLAVAGPLGKDAAAGGNLPLASRAGEGPNVHFVATGFIGLIGKPAAVGREGGFHFAGRTVQERLWLPGLPAGLLIAFDGKSQNVKSSVGVLLG